VIDQDSRKETKAMGSDSIACPYCLSDNTRHIRDDNWFCDDCEEYFEWDTSQMESV